MFVVRAIAVVENRVLCREIAWIGIEPRVDMLRLDGDDAAIMARGGNLRRRLIGDGREREQIRLARGLASVTTGRRRACPERAAA